MMGDRVAVRVLASVASALLFTLFTGAAAEALAPEWGTVGNWAVHVDRTLGMGCFVITLNKKGAVFRIGLNPAERSAYIVLGSPAWRSLEDGRQYNLEITFGNEPAWKAPAKAVRYENGLSLLWINTEASATPLLLRDFRHEREVTIAYRGDDIESFPLTDSDAAAAAMFECQSAMDATVNDRDPFYTPPEGRSADPFEDDSGLTRPRTPPPAATRRGVRSQDTGGSVYDSTGDVLRVIQFAVAGASLPIAR